MEEHYEFLRSGEQQDIDAFLKTLDEAYYSGEAQLTDEQYDQLVKIYESRFGKREKVGSEPTHSTVALPIAMMSLDKVMSEKEIEKFVEKNSGPYIVMDKVNGNSALYINEKNQQSLYNRGNGTHGSDLSHILPFLNLPTPNQDLYVKGELVITKEDYEPFKDDYRTNLSMINGLLFSKSADPERLKLFKFIAYDLTAINPKQSYGQKMSQILFELEKLGFTVPFYKKVDVLVLEDLSALFKERKEAAEYDIDGLVIVADRPISYEERLIRENPKYSVAFKEYGETAVATVDSVVWEASKHGVIKPVVKIHPVMIGSFTIKSLTAFNAKWIVDNNVGPGTQLLITHNTIPYILQVLEGTEASMPDEELYPEGSWQWNETEVDIVLLEENDEVKIAKIYEFFRQIGAKFWGETTVGKLYHGGFDSVKKLLEADRDEILDAGIPGVGAGTIDRIMKTRDEALEVLDLTQLMSASSAFGLGFGVRKLALITDEYPDVLSMDLTVEDIVSIKGFAQKTAERFINGLPRFVAFTEEIPMLAERFLPNNLKAVSPKKTPVKAASPKKAPVKATPKKTASPKKVPAKAAGAKKSVSPATATKKAPAKATHKKAIAESDEMDESTEEDIQVGTVAVGSPNTSPNIPKVSASHKVAIPSPPKAALKLNTSVAKDAPKSTQNTQTIKGKTVVFTGFRDKGLEAIIKAQGGKTTTSVSKSTSYVVVGGKKGVGSSKESKALEYGVPIVSLAEFKQMFGL